MTRDFAEFLRALALFGLLWGWIQFAFWFAGDFLSLNVVERIGRDYVMPWTAKAGIPSEIVLVYARMSWFGSAILIWFLPLILMETVKRWLKTFAGRNATTDEHGWTRIW